MTSTQKQMMIGCIATNLVAGNLYIEIFLGNTTSNSYIVTNVLGSIACVLCFVFLFVKIRPATRNVFLLWLLSFATCVAVCILSSIIFVLIFSGVIVLNDLGEVSLNGFFQVVLAGLFISSGSIVMTLPFILPMSFVNLIWLLLFVKCPSREK